ncbi:MAG: carbohydrate ABC transporter permease [Sphaerochaeta sp.]|jgi:multiple sugar transport system permease protein|uniref:carbohydrate ABC transporter permease n=1 Tax=Sphaerochaeta sp. TaxID=1972642 RepID=UPI002FCB3384
MTQPSYRWHSHLTPWVFILPTVIGLLIFRLIPIVASFYLSFTDWNLLGSPLFIKFGNYMELVKSEEFVRIVLNTFQFSCIYVIGSMIFGLLLAVLINTRIKGIAFFRAAIYLPVVTSAVAVGVVWNWMLGPTYGVINNLIEAIGLTPPYWLGDTKLVLNTVAFVQVWKMSGYYMIIFLAGLQNIPRDTLESARVDGANTVQSFFRITLPMLMPTLFFVLTIAIIDSFKNFELIYAMTKGGPQNASNTLVYDVYLNAFVYYRVGFASSIAYVLLIFVGLLTIGNFYIKKYLVQSLD